MRWITRFFTLCSLFVISACNPSPDLLQNAETQSPSLTFEATQVDKAPSATATQAATLVPTQTPYPTSGPTSTPGSLPSTEPGLFTHHLIWLDEQYGRLLRLNKDTGDVEVLAGMDNESIYQTRGRVFAYHTHPDTQKILLWSQVQSTLEGFPVIDLVLLNLFSHEHVVLYSHTGEWHGTSPDEEVQSFALSPDGQWAAFLLHTVSPGDEIFSNTLYILAVDGTRNPVEIASCEAEYEDYYQGGGCILGNLIWSETSRILAWQGYQGLWLYTRGSVPELVLEHLHNLDTITRDRNYSPIAFSPDDRFLMINIRGWEGGTRGVFDTATGQIAEMPDTWWYSYAPESSAIWLSDGRILITRSHDDLDELHPGGILRIYSIDSKREGLLQQDLLFEIPPELGNTPYSPIEVREGVFRFGLASFDAMGESYPYALRDVYYYDFEEQNLELIQVQQHQLYWPGGHCYGYVYDCNWVPDGSGRFIWGAEIKDDEINITNQYFLPMDGSERFDATQILDEDFCCYTWKK